MNASNRGVGGWMAGAAALVLLAGGCSKGAKEEGHAWKTSYDAAFLESYRPNVDAYLPSVVRDRMRTDMNVPGAATWRSAKRKSISHLRCRHRRSIVRKMQLLSPAHNRSATSSGSKFSRMISYRF